MNKDILDIPIVAQNDTSIFSGACYVVPIYQRAFAWGTGDSVRRNEIIQLMDDVYEFQADHYRLGSLIVARRGDNKFEVIDGQQRLTALFLILSRLKIHLEKGSLSYACRPSAEAVLESIAKESFSLGEGVTENDPALGIVAGLRAIAQKIESQDNPENYKRTLREKFKRTVICRIVVPENTDLNRYFEIMNTRGEQLEPQDIVKAHLMAELDDETEQSAFATIWDACSDMDGYCQMHFHDKNQRNQIFGNNWTELISCNNGADLLQSIKTPDAADKAVGQSCQSFRNLVLYAPENPVVEGEHGEQYSRFESIIDFRHFLLHSLNVFGEGEDTRWTLNDFKLIEAFDDALKHWKSSSAAFSRAFILHLLKCRCLFDRYVIKRFSDANGRSAWCLNELEANSDGGPSYRQTWQGNSEGNEKVLMLEACMRVSYLDPKSMYWLTALLEHLVKNSPIISEGIIELLDGMAKKEISKFFAIDNHACMGVATPHVVFNYLDYLLWTRKDEVEEILQIPGFVKGFTFEYRSSVEHWYPRTPPNGEEWPDVNRFGNLCILRGDINSKFSNLLPESKQLNREQYIKLEHQSLKLRIMAKMTETSGWKRDSCATHETMMLRVLRGEPMKARDNMYQS